MQLVPSGLLCPEHAFYQGPLLVFLSVKQACGFFSVRLSTADCVLSLLDVGSHAHLEDQFAVVVRIVPLITVKDASCKVKPAASDLGQHRRKHGRVTGGARRGKRGQYYLQAQNGRYVVFPVDFLGFFDKITLLCVRFLDVCVPRGLGRAAVCAQWPRLPRLPRRCSGGQFLPRSDQANP